MTRQPMPPAEVDLGETQVSALIAAQYPALAEQEVTPIGQGWDNFLFRIGEAHIARFPRRSLAVALVTNESRWLPELAPGLPLRIPAPIHVGKPGHGYPWPWTIVPFIEGEPAGEVAFDPGRTADALGRFLASLHRPAPEDAPLNPYRGMHLAERDALTRERLSVLTADTRLEDAWERACRTEPWSGPGLWLHGDLHPQNILIVQEAPSGVIDFGDITSGDPATDLAVAWMLFDEVGRSQLFDAYGGADDQTLVRAMGWALSLALAYVAHGADNEAMSRIGTVTLERIATGIG